VTRLREVLLHVEFAFAVAAVLASLTWPLARFF
jgi:hypothetical protein